MRAQRTKTARWHDQADRYQKELEGCRKDNDKLSDDIVELRTRTKRDEERIANLTNANLELHEDLRAAKRRSSATSGALYAVLQILLMGLSVTLVHLLWFSKHAHSNVEELSELCSQGLETAKMLLKPVVKPEEAQLPASPAVVPDAAPAPSTAAAQPAASSTGGDDSTTVGDGSSNLMWSAHSAGSPASSWVHADIASEAALVKQLEAKTKDSTR